MAFLSALSNYEKDFGEMIDFSVNVVRRTGACDTPKESYAKMDLKKRRRWTKKERGLVFGQISQEKAQ